MIRLLSCTDSVIRPHIAAKLITDTHSWDRAAWGKANKVFNQEVLFLSDPGSEFSKSIGWSNGAQAARYAIALDNGVVVYAGKDERGQFNVRHTVLAAILQNLQVLTMS